MLVLSKNFTHSYELYPQIAEDYERVFRVLKSLPCDFFLILYPYLLSVALALVPAATLPPAISLERLVHLFRRH